MAGESEYLRTDRAFASNDLDEVRAYIGTVFKPHTVKTRGRAGSVATIVNHRATAGGSLVYFGYGDVTVEVDPGSLDDFYLLQFACTGSGRMNYGARASTVRRSVSRVVNPSRS